MAFELPTFKTKKELFDHLVKNEEYILEEKMAEFKKADGVGFLVVTDKAVGKDQTDKSTPSSLLEKDMIEVVAIINTTNIMDSHKDVHIPGIWDKSLKENKRIKHLQEHVNKFDHIISDKEDLKAYTKTYTWKELGYDADGETQALVFESKVRKERNQFMHEQYAKGNVDNHSVGMIYVKLVTCINDDDYGAQKEAWDKYFPMVVNQKDAEKSGYFWAVTEAKVREGSAVVDGSNFVTPTTSIKQLNVIDEQTVEESKYKQAVKNWLSAE